MATELSQALVDAAAEAIDRSDSAFLKLPDEEFVAANPYQLSARAAVAAVLETLAAHCDPVPAGEGSTSQALLSNTELRRLAAEAREEGV